MGQEVNVALLVENRIRSRNIPVKAIVVIDEVRGFIMVEAMSPHHVDLAVTGIKHVKGKVRGKVNPMELERLLMPKPVIEGLDIGDIIEVVSGPLKGMRAKVIRLDRARQEVTVELLEVPYPLPITINADYVKLIEKVQK